MTKDATQGIMLYVHAHQIEKQVELWSTGEWKDTLSVLGLNQRPQD